MIVPQGQTLSIDVHTPILRVLLIDGGTVLFDDNQNVSLHSDHILIVKGGLLQVRAVSYVRMYLRSYVRVSPNTLEPLLQE